MEPQSILALTFFSFLSIVVGGSAGILKNGNFFSETEYKVKTPLVPPPQKKSKFKFVEQEPTIIEVSGWTLPQGPITIEENKTIQYGKRSFGDEWKNSLIDKSKPEWFKTGEEIVFKFKEEHDSKLISDYEGRFKSISFRRLRDEILKLQKTALTGSLLQKWCAESYKKHHDGNVNANLSYDVWFFCHINRTKGK